MAHVTAIKRKVLVFVSLYLPGFKGGGPIRTIANLVDSVGDSIDFDVVCLDRDLGDERPYPGIKMGGWQQVGKARVFYVQPGIRGATEIYRIIRSHDYECMYLNSFFHFQFSFLPLLFSKLLRKHGKILLAPRGEFSEGALGLNSFKKKVFLAFSKYSHLHHSVEWHATSKQEEIDINRIASRVRSVKFATNLPSVRDAGAFPLRDVNLPLKVVMLGRVAPMKNVVGAIEILSYIKSNVKFDLFGPREDQAYWKQCEDALLHLPGNIEFNYCGALSPEDVGPTLEQYDVFLLPTLGENFGHVIAEALTAGLPVVLSQNTPWRDMELKSLGFDIPLNDLPLFAKKIDFISTIPADDFMVWRKNIAAWARDNLKTRELIAQSAALFE